MYSILELKSIAPRWSQSSTPTNCNPKSPHPFLLKPQEGPLHGQQDGVRAGQLGRGQGDHQETSRARTMLPGNPLLREDCLPPGLYEPTFILSL